MDLNRSARAIASGELDGLVVRFVLAVGVRQVGAGHVHWQFDLEFD